MDEKLDLAAIRKTLANTAWGEGTRAAFLVCDEVDRLTARVVELETELASARPGPRTGRRQMKLLVGYELDAAEKRANEATDGPWKFTKTSNKGFALLHRGSVANEILFEDAYFISHVRADAPRAYATIRDLEKRVSAMTEGRNIAVGLSKEAARERDALAERLHRIAKISDMTDPSTREQVVIGGMMKVGQILREINATAEGTDK